MNVIQTKRLTKVYGTKKAGILSQALTGINLEVNSGEFVGIMGPSGSGKTTLLNILAGLDQATSGEFLFQGQDMTRLKPEQMALFRRKHLGFVFQDYNLLETLTLAENVALPLVLAGQKERQVKQRVIDLLNYLGLSEVMGRYPYEVSGGQQQRTAVARAIVREPALILADEPTGNLDSGSSAVLLELFSRLNQDKGATLLMVTHDPFSASYCRRVVFIKDGTIFSNMEKSGSRQAFFQEILDTLAVMEGSVR